MGNYQDIYPSDPLIRSQETVRPRVADLLNLEYFEADPGAMPTRAFDQHHVLLNLKEEPHRVENWRDGTHRDFTYRTNEVIITPAGIESGWRWHARSKVIVVTIEPKKLERFTQMELGVLLTSEQFPDVPQVKDADLTAAAANALDELRNIQTGSDVMYECLARVFLVKLVRKYGQEQTEAFEFSQQFTAVHYKRILNFVADHFGRVIAVEEMAEQADLSASHFSRVFKETIGESPHQFVTRYRVEQAQRMLAEPSRSLIDIALACGFSDQPHFSRVFKRLTGVTPRGFRDANSR